MFNKFQIFKFNIFIAIIVLNKSLLKLLSFAFKLLSFALIAKPHGNTRKPHVNTQKNDI